MQAAPAFSLPDARRLIVWCLLIALPIYGWSATVVGLVGVRHVHRVVAEAAGGWPALVDFRRTDHVAEGTPHVHSHAGFQRHHHAVGDTTVMALDGGASHGDAAEGGNAAGGPDGLIWALAGALYIVPAAQMTQLRWRSVDASAIANCGVEPLERPPKTI